ncbi:MAG: protein-L-isoaspartate(D-aspartate) O-methyltransferase [Gammaproteobacteria bacterium]|nr:protein-L-isoaspartate(D-aspartate) O-methyltransferase [Gammaproteobacteria bacterium]
MDTIGMNTSARARQRLIARLKQQQFVSDEVLDVIDYVPRHKFVDPAMAHRAYDDTVLPIGYQQTISQPSVVAMMSTAVTGSARRDRVLEIGTGSGYQTAILAYLFHEVYTIERIERLQLRARDVIQELGIDNVNFRFGDGFEGWCERAPFDAIIGTAGAETVPASLSSQLALHGRLVMPIADRQSFGQSLIQWERRHDRIEERELCAVRFVPMLEGVAAGS